jgi:hypothetical protein
MTDWQERADEMKDSLQQLDDWLPQVWDSLPKGVQKIICRGQIAYADKIILYEDWAKKESEEVKTC